MMSSMPCACQRSQLSVQAFCAQPKLQCRGVNRSHGVKSAYLGQRLLSQRLGKSSTLRRNVEDGCQFRRKTTISAVFGVGAPEAIVVGVVALVVFGPKGLAEAAKSLGKSLRGFAPTIRELAGVSNELKQTLEQEIGLDEIRREWRDGSSSSRYPPYRDESTSSGNRLESNAEATTDSQPAKPQLKEASEEIAKEVDPSIEAKRAESARMAWGNTPSTSNVSNQSHESQEVSKAPTAEAAAAPKTSGPSSDGMTIEQLEAELAKRRAKTPSQSSNK